MKRFSILALLLLFFIPTSGNAQFKLKVGPLLGMNYNIGTGSDLDQSLTGIGMVIGGQADMSFTPQVGLLVNMMFYDNRSGSNSTEGTVQGLSYTVNQDVSLAYFMIEPLFKLGIPMSGFYFVAGPVVGFNVEGSSEFSITSQNNQVTFQDGSTKSKQSLKNLLVRFGLKFGAGYDISVGSVSITPQLGFEYGLTKVQSDVDSRVLTIQALVITKFRVL